MVSEKSGLSGRRWREHRKRLVDWVRLQLIGPARDGLLKGSPLERYPIGVLHPVEPGFSGLDPASPEEDEDHETPLGDDQAKDLKMAQPVRRRRYVPPSSVGFSFFVRSGDGVSLRITASAAVYERTGERDDRGRFRGREYRRKSLECAMEWTGGESRQSEDVLLEVRQRPHGQGRILTVVFANRRKPARIGEDRDERCLFEAGLECEVVNGELAEYPRVDPSLLTEEERELELQYRDKCIYAVGHGAAVDWSVESGTPPTIRARFMPEVDVPLVTVKARDVDEEILVMKDLAEASGEAVPDRLDAFVDGYERWIREQSRDAEDLETAVERATAERICGRMATARDRMRRGVALLRADAGARFAFRQANRAMLAQMRQQDRNRAERKRDEPRDSREYRWRPFQLAFLLAVIESTVREEDDFRGVLDLIWFPTGGGKTEAYLGLVAFLIVWRRLQHGTLGGGTVVLMRYTLRLLTRQQFERATRIICALELLRRENPERLGDEPITVGMWVGRAASPNTCPQAKDCVKELAAGDEDAGHQLVLRTCPWCNREFEAPRSYRATLESFAFLCRNPECEFGPDGESGEPTPLPCNVVDEALYQRPPTLLIATIDKFARLAWEERSSVFLGRRRPGSRFPRRPPELVIQDELHLIAGPLGSVAGLYEAGLETVLEQRGVSPKYVASTATICMAREQVRRLYGRELAVFPPPGLSAEDSWFARTDPSRPGRLYIGYLAPALDQRRCLAPLAAALLHAPLAVFQDQQDRDDLLEAWWTQVIYHGSLRGVGNSHNAFATSVRDLVRRLDREHRQAVRDGAGSDGESTADPERTDTGGAAELRQNVVQLTSFSPPQRNARTFDQLHLRRGEPDCLDAVLATNMISVGVDVNRLATMVINGQPLTTAEYVQASSRIGRAAVPGLVFANYYRHQARSLSHYETFRPYHESFYRFVEPTSVTPFTYQVRTRALHAALVTALRHGCDALSRNEDAGAFDANDDRVRAVIERLKRRCREAEEARGEITGRHLDRLAERWHQEARRCERQRRRLSYRANDRSADGLLRQFDESPSRGLWRTLNSMRNVEDTGVLQRDD